jgi:hypothetical protein
MWSRTFAQRLASWTELRNHAQHQGSAALALGAINSWWFDAPWQPYHLHWDDQTDWPDPWQLLDDNIYCSLARGLGILYTIALLDRADLSDAVLAETADDNLVLVQGEKYILNWDKDTVVNINLGPYKVQHSVQLSEIKQKLR